MGIKRLIVLLGTFVASAAVLSAVEKGDTLKLMTYNLRFGELASMEQIAGYISSQLPDIVALQECDWATNRTRAPHQNGVKFVNSLHCLWCLWRLKLPIAGRSSRFPCTLRQNRRIRPSNHLPCLL